MNILFLVFSFLLLFSFFNAALLKNSHFFSQEQNSFCVYLDSKQKLQNKWENYKYFSSFKKKESVSKNKTSKAPPQKGIFISHRMKTNTPLIGKWNLYPLFTADRQGTAFLRECTENLLKELYSHAPFWKAAQEKTPELAHCLVSSFLQKQSLLENSSLSGLFPQDSDLQDVFYKMLKGSGLYDLAKKQGYPPLEDFMYLQKEESKVASLPHASLPILKSLFQESVVDEILQIEKGKWDLDNYHHSITKEELLELCTEKSLTVLGKKFQDLEPLLSFSRQTAKLDTLVYQNKKNKIRIKKPIS